MRKNWTVEEANQALPYLREIVTVLVEQNKRSYLARQTLVDMEERVRGNGHDMGLELEHRHTRLRDALGQVRQGLDQLRRLGCEVKDLDAGLVDFPSIRNGREVLLCWQLGEPAVLYWHDSDKGFASRQPL